LPRLSLEYEAKLKAAALHTHTGVNTIQKSFQEFKLKFPRPATNKLNTENCLGDHITNSQNCFNSFQAHNAQDLQDCILAIDVNDSASCNMIGHKAELFYEMSSSMAGSNCAFSIYSINSSNNLYSIMAQNSKDIFGCSQVQQAQYCILNKQYTKEEYEALLPRIIEHMKSTGEWGQFFPNYICHFPYNDTLAQEYFPLTKEQAIQEGYTWKDKNLSEYQPTTFTPQDDINQVDSSITKEILSCEITGKNYRITPAEFKFYQQMQIPIPFRDSETRHKDRFNMRNKPRLRKAVCAKTGQEIHTTYPKNTPYTIYSEQAYNDYLYGNH